MYKTRLSRWGVAKNVRRKTNDKSCAVAAKTSSSSPASSSTDCFSARGCSPCCECRSKDTLLRLITRRPRVRLPPELGVIDHELGVNDALVAMHAHMSGLRDRDRGLVHFPARRVLGDSAACEIVDFPAQLATGVLHVRHGHHAAGFRLVQDCFGRLDALLDEPSPLNTMHTFTNSLILLSVSEPLWRMWLTYTCQLVAAKFGGPGGGTLHPLHQLASALLSLGPRCVILYSAFFFRAWLDFLADAMGAEAWGHDGRMLANWLVQGQRTFLLAYVDQAEYEKLCEEDEQEEDREERETRIEVRKESKSRSPPPPASLSLGANKLGLDSPPPPSTIKRRPIPALSKLTTTSPSSSSSSSSSSPGEEPSSTPLPLLLPSPPPVPTPFIGHGGSRVSVAYNPVTLERRSTDHDLDKLERLDLPSDVKLKVDMFRLALSRPARLRIRRREGDGIKFLAFVPLGEEEREEEGGGEGKED